MRALAILVGLLCFCTQIQPTVGVQVNDKAYWVDSVQGQSHKTLVQINSKSNEKKVQQHSQLITKKKLTQLKSNDPENSTLTIENSLGESLKHILNTNNAEQEDNLKIPSQSEKDEHDSNSLSLLLQDNNQSLNTVGSQEGLIGVNQVRSQVLNIPEVKLRSQLSSENSVSSSIGAHQVSPHVDRHTNLIENVRNYALDAFFNSFAQQKSASSDPDRQEFSIGDFIMQKHILIFMGAILTVGGCCLVSQCLVRMSKNYRLQLNKYYSKKRYEKAKLIQQYLNQEEQVHYEQADLDEEMLRRAQEEDDLLQEQQNIGEELGNGLGDNNDGGLRSP
eukprot:403356348